LGGSCSTDVTRKAYRILFRNRRRKRIFGRPKRWQTLVNTVMNFPVTNIQGAKFLHEQSDLPRIQRTIPHAANPVGNKERLSVLLLKREDGGDTFL
jgi:hypothetical protein